MLNRRSFVRLAAAVPLAKSANLFPAVMRPAPKYKACVIGDTKNGGYGHHLHLMWELRDDVEVVALADPDEKGRSQFGAEAKAKRTYADYREMLEKEKPDFVSIGPRWTVNHEKYLMDCVEVGAHGLMEKPLAVDLAETDRMVAATESKGLRWSLAFNFRASPVVDHARKMIMEEGLIGDVLEVRSRGKEDKRAGGEDLIVMGVHIFDMMISFMDFPQWCSSSISVDGRTAVVGDVGEASEPLGPVVGDRIQATYGFKGGVNGYFTSMENRDGNGGRWGLEIFGSKGIVTIRMQEIPGVYWLDEPSWAPGDKDVDWKILPGCPQLEKGKSRVWHYQPILDDLIRAVEEGRSTRFSFKDGRAATEMIQAANESHIKGGSPVGMPLQNRTHPLKRW